MGRGSSGAGGGGKGGGASLQTQIKNAENGISPDGKEVTFEDVQAISNNSYQLRDLDTLSSADRSRLSEMIYGSIIINGAVAKNSMVSVKTLNEIDFGGIAKPISINISQFSGSELSDLIKISKKAGAANDSGIIRDSLRLLTYYNQ